METKFCRGHEWCPDCGEVLPFASFGRNAASPTGRASYCKPCHNSRGRNSEELAGGARTHPLKRRYGITAVEADAMPEAQGGLQRGVFYLQHHMQQQAIATLVAASDAEADAASRPGEPPVGSQRRPGARGTSTRSTGWTSGARRREQAGEGDA